MTKKIIITLTPAEAFEIKAAAASRLGFRSMAAKVRAAEAADDATGKRGPLPDCATCPNKDRRGEDATRNNARILAEIRRLNREA